MAKVWTRLLDVLQLPADPARVARIIDWLDADSATVNTWGAEQPDYDDFRPPRVVANTRVSDVTELAAISGYEVWEVQRLAAWLSALPSDTAININTASDEILLALSGALNEQFVVAVLENRPFNTVAEFHSVIANEFLLIPADVATRWPPRMIDVKTDYFELYLDVTLGEAHIEVKSIMSRRGLKEPVVISRTITLVPASLPDRVSDQLSGAEELFADKGRDEEITRMAAGNIAPEPACLMIGKNS
jgi:general secretion pathway protein K